jgi:hypothetical protein
MRAPARLGSGVVGLALTVLVACSAATLPTPAPTASVASSVATATLTPMPGAPDGGWVERAVPETTTTGGADLASTVDGQTRFIHIVYNVEEGLEGGWDASLYLRTQNEGQAWSERLLIEGVSPRIATAGPNVYLAFQAYRCGGAGLLRNRDHGRRNAWSALTCVTRSREMRPDSAMAIAATDTLVYLASVDVSTHRTGVRISRDHGTTWRQVDMGPARGDESGVVGPVEMAATGRLAAVLWSDRGTTFARSSVDAGAHWSAATTLSGGIRSASAGDSRLAFGGTDSDGSPRVLIWTEADGWRAVAVPGGASTVPIAQSSDVALGPGMSVAASYAGSCPADMAQLQGDTRWTASADGGLTWKELQPLPRCATDLAMVWADDGRAFLLFYGEDGSYVLAVHP